jgi:hypothetical protein
VLPVCRLPGLQRAASCRGRSIHIGSAQDRAGRARPARERADAPTDLAPDRRELRRRVGQRDFAASIARAQAGATVHLNAANMAAVAVAELTFVGIRGLMPLRK